MPTVKRPITIGPADIAGLLGQDKELEGQDKETIRPPTISEKLWDYSEPLRKISNFIFGEDEVEQAKTALAPSPLAATFLPRNTIQRKAFETIRKYHPEVEENVMRHFPYQPGKDPGGTDKKYMFIDPNTGEDLMLKVGDQTSDESILSPFISIASKIGGAKKTLSPAIKVAGIKTDWIDPFDDIEGTLQRFAKGNETYSKKFKTYQGGKPIIPSLEAQENMARTLPAEWAAGLGGDRHNFNYIVDDANQVYPIDMGFGLHVKPPRNYAGSPVYARSLDPQHDQYLREAFIDASNRISDRGLAPYEDIFNLAGIHDYHNPDRYKAYIQDQLDKLRDPFYRTKIWNEIRSAR